MLCPALVPSLRWLSFVSSSFHFDPFVTPLLSYPSSLRSLAAPLRFVPSLPFHLASYPLRWPLFASLRCALCSLPFVLSSLLAIVRFSATHFFTLFASSSFAALSAVFHSSA